MKDSINTVYNLRVVIVAICMPEVSTTQAQIEDFYLNKSRTVMESMDIQKGEGGGGILIGALNHIYFSLI